MKTLKNNLAQGKVTLSPVKSDIKKYDGKLYVDEKYGHEEPTFPLNFCILQGDWAYELDQDNDYSYIKFISFGGGHTLELAFSSLMARNNFTKEITSPRPIKQLSSGIDIEKYANTRGRKDKGIKIGIGIAVGLVLAKLFARKK